MVAGDVTLRGDVREDRHLLAAKTRSAGRLLPAD